VLVKNIRPKECVKADPTLPVDGRFYGTRQYHQCKEKLPEETTTTLKPGRRTADQSQGRPAEVITHWYPAEAQPAVKAAKMLPRRYVSFP
jgi:hypothetical protein